MKSPFAIVLAIVVLIGIVIAAAAIFFLAPAGESEKVAIGFAAEGELPTPTTRNVPAQQQTDGEATPAEVVVVSTSVIPKKALSTSYRKRSKNASRAAKV